MSSFPGIDPDTLDVQESLDDHSNSIHERSTPLELSPQSYAWLELEAGMWHFLTHICADPLKSTRRWSDKSLALDELKREGWTVVRPYPQLPSVEPSDRVYGYGLTRFH
jgi:hypothetical protein